MKSSSYPLVVLLLLIALVAGVFVYGRSVIMETITSGFQKTSEEFASDIELKASAPLQVVSNTRGLFLASEEVNRGEFAAFVDFQSNKEAGLYNGINAISYISRIANEEVVTFEESIQGDISVSPFGYPDFHIYPQTESIEYYPITFIEPRSDQVALGFDVRSVPERRRALEWARDQDTITLSEPVELIEQQETRLAFLVSAPLYADNADSVTRQDRRDSLNGFVQASVFYDELFRETVEHYGDAYELSFRLYDTDPLNGDRSLVMSDESVDADRTPEYTLSIEVGDRIWELETYMGKNYRQRARIIIIWWIAFGLFLAVVVGVFLLLRLVPLLQSRLKISKEELSKIQKELSQQRDKKELEQALASLEEEKVRAEEKTKQLEQLNQMMVHRELRMSEMKRELEAMRAKSGSVQKDTGVNTASEDLPDTNQNRVITDS